MALHLYCPSSSAVLLLAIADEQGTLHFPGGTDEWPGVWLTVKPLLPINQQLGEAAEKALNQEGLARSLEINQQFAAKLSDQEGNPATLYLGVLAPGQIENANRWPTLPQLLEKMPRNRQRLAYLLALQVLSGALTQETQAIEMDEAFFNRLNGQGGREAET